MKKNKTPSNTRALDKVRVLELLATNAGANKRDLAKLLGLKGSDRIVLKRILKELEADSAIAGRQKQGFVKRGELPEVGIIEVTGSDDDGETLARPLAWDSNEEPQTIYVMPPKDGAAPGPGDRMLARLERHGEAYEAHVIRRLEQETQTRLIGVLRDAPATGWRLVPINKKERTEYALDKSDLGGAKHNELVVAEPKPGRIAGFSRVKVVERIGSMDSPKTISLIAIHDHGIPTEFPTAVIEEAKAAKPIQPQGRTDLRAIPLVTIDPPDARDHDDAVWAGLDDDPANAGGHIVLVAIADVAHYVTPGSALDKEAFKRGNSAYFPDRVVPMLPEVLSADVCSLKEGEDRAAMACHLRIAKDGTLKAWRFTRAVVRIAANVAYEDAQAWVDANASPLPHEEGIGGGAEVSPSEASGAAPHPNLSPEGRGQSGVLAATLPDLWACWRELAAARDRREPLELDLPERRVVLDEKGRLLSVAPRERLDAHRLVEDYMIAANVAAAKALEAKKAPVMYRVHEPPAREKLVALKDYLATYDIAFALGQVVRPKTFNHLLDRVGDADFRPQVMEQVLRSQTQA